MKPPAKTLVNFRLLPDLLEAIDAAAALAGLNRTEWVTSTLTIAARQELGLVTVSVAAKVPPAALAEAIRQGVVDGCPHPKHLRHWERRGLCCQVCGSVLERRRQGA